MHSLLTATVLLLFSVSVFAETVMWGRTLGLGEKSIASVSFKPGILSLSPQQPSYPESDICVSLAGRNFDQYVQIGTVSNTIDPECVFFSGTECNEESSERLGATFLFPTKLPFLPGSFKCTRK